MGCGAPFAREVGPARADLGDHASLDGLDRRSCVLALPFSRGAACFGGMLASTRIGNVPINEIVVEMDPEIDHEEFAGLRKRWDRLHTLRVVLSVAGLGSLAEDRR